MLSQSAFPHGLLHCRIGADWASIPQWARAPWESAQVVQGPESTSVTQSVIYIHLADQLVVPKYEW